ncbi:MAG: DUF4410 domain-containing protein [Deltaproteobacteria bacterium]|nr:DUF4410 domain-containing protein [Deltaproteobacteria bacterium]
MRLSRVMHAKGFMLVLIALIGAVWLGGCAGAGISIIRTDLKPGDLSRADSLVIKPAQADQTEFLGDFSDDPPSVVANRDMLKNNFAQNLLPLLLGSGFKAEMAGASIPVGAVTVEMVVEKFEAGSNAARAMVGMGAGASYLLTTVKLTKNGQVIADFTIDASSGGRGGFSSIGSFLQQHIDDSLWRFVSYLEEKAQP